MTRRALLTVFGLGRLTPAPGSWGSLVAPVLALALLAGAARPWLVNVVLAAMAVIFAAVCVLYGEWAERDFGKRDPRQIVADEVAGQSLALLFLPWRQATDEAAWPWNIALAATAFVAFRFFDILKPPPVGSVQRIPGGWGILLDDVLAGLLALVVGHLLAWFVWPGVV